MNEPTVDKPAAAAPVIGVALAVAVLAGGAWWYWHGRAAPPGAEPPGAEVVSPPTAEAPASAVPRIEHPVPTAPAAAAPNHPLPGLNDSDAAINESLAAATAGLPLGQFLVPESLIRHFVVTVDNLPRQKLAPDRRPVVPTPGVLLVEGDELHATLDARNFARYEPLVDLLRKVDMQRLAALYLQYYPLFQQAYQDLGYPTGYFNDRLVSVIDLMLATPQVAAPIDLVRPGVLYVFADPALESLPAGQKVLIRMGPDNAAAVKAKLMELRALITAAAPRH